jgi:hypothetical protein
MSSQNLNKTFTESNIDGLKILASWNHKEKAHRYKQKLEKSYILHRMINAEKKVKQDEKIQEGH